MGTALQRLQRQTDLSLTELIGRINGTSENHFPKCLCINEVGMICINGEDQDGEGENALLLLLDSRSDEDRAISFAWISVIEKLSQKHSAVLAEFPQKAENKAIMPAIDRMMNDFASIVN